MLPFSVKNAVAIFGIADTNWEKLQIDQGARIARTRTLLVKTGAGTFFSGYFEIISRIYFC